MAINEAFRDWVTNMDTTHYVLGTACGPHPFPEMVAWLQSIIGEEALLQLAKVDETPDVLVGCTGGGSNFGGLAFPFLREKLAGLNERAVSYDKGCYLGQEVVCMLEQRGQLRRHLVKLESSAEPTVVLNDGVVRQVRMAQFRPYPEPVSRVVFDLADLGTPQVVRTNEGLLITFGGEATSTPTTTSCCLRPSHGKPRSRSARPTIRGGS